MFLSRRILINQIGFQRNFVIQPNFAVNNDIKLEYQTLDHDDLLANNVGLVSPRKPVNNQSTDQVTNQVPPLEYLDLYKSDHLLRSFFNKENSGQIEEMGEELGVFHWFEQGNLANQYPPTLNQFDRYGQRIDEVHYHSSYHNLMRIGMRYGVHSVAWQCLPGRNASLNPYGHLQHAASLYMLAQVETGVCYPLSMTHSGYPVLHRYLHCTSQSLVDSFPLDKLLSNKYDQRCLPANIKSSLNIGMALTEKQGGSNLCEYVTTAFCDNSVEKRFILTGHKSFCSAPMSDGFLVLAQIHDEKYLNSSNQFRNPSCFFVPRWLPNGQPNLVEIQRIKNKLGNRSNATCEIEFNQTKAWLIGKEDDGVKVIMEMIHGTRLDCAISSAALMRQSLVQATWHARHRKTLGRPLIDHALMKSLLVDILLESEAATVLVMHLATLFDATYNKIHSNNTNEIQAFARIANALAKFWICKRAPETIYEALESVGGVGYTEESILARMYREAPFNNIWESSGNVICLDILRSLKSSPESLQAYFLFMYETRGSNKHLDASLELLERKLLSKSISTDEMERYARTLISQMAICLQASLMIRRLPQSVSDSFCSSRLGPNRASIFGDLPFDVDTDALVKRLPN